MNDDITEINSFLPPISDEKVSDFIISNVFINRIRSDVNFLKYDCFNQQSQIQKVIFFHVFLN